MAVNIAPQTSSTLQPGYVPNPGGAYSGGAPSNAYYRQTLAEWMASMWAQGGDSRNQVLDMMSPVWYSNQFGEPDPTDADGVYSPRTLISFSRFASQYQGGSPGLDQIFPYVPPGNNEFIETPEQTATRIAQANFERGLEADLSKTMAQIAAQAAEGAANRAFQAGENAADRQLEAAKANQAVMAQMEGIKAQIKTAAMAAFNDAFSNEVSKYSVQAGIYNNQQSIQSSNKQAAGSLASVYQQVLDERTNKAIQAQLNPGDFLAREAQVRAMQGPQGTEVPAYSTFDKLLQIIDDLMNTPGGTEPTAPDMNAFVPPPALQQLMNYQPQTPAMISAPAATGGGGGGGGSSVQDAIAALLKAGYGDSSQRAAAGAGTTTQPKPAATSGSGVASSQPYEFSGVRNEDVAYLTPGQRALVTTGTAGPSYGRDYTQYRVYNPNNNNSLYGPDDAIAPGSAVWLERFANGIIGMEPYMRDQKEKGFPEMRQADQSTFGYKPGSQPLGYKPMQDMAQGMMKNKGNSATFMTGDPTNSAPTQPNPEVVEIVNPAPDTRVNVTPVIPYGNDNRMNAVPERARLRNQLLMQFMKRFRGPRFAEGVDMFDPNTLKLKTYPDEAYQNYSTLKYFQGGMGKQSYDTLATGFSKGYGGGLYPESGNINFGRYLNVAKDPVALAMLASGYKSANRDLFAEVARAKARAPFGQSVQTSLIRT